MVRVGDRAHLEHGVADVVEWRRAIDHLVQDAAERPGIARAADLQVAHAVAELDGLGAHVVERSNLS